MAAKQGKGKKQQSPGKKLKREACRARAKVKRAARRDAQNERAAMNRADREAGIPTPWEKAKAERKFIRFSRKYDLAT